MTDPIIIPKYLVILILTGIPFVMMGVGLFFYFIKDKGFGLLILFGGIAIGIIMIFVVESGIITTPEVLEVEYTKQTIPISDCDTLRKLAETHPRFKSKIVDEIVLRCLK